MDILIAIPAFNEQEDLKKTVKAIKSGIGSSFKYKLLLLNDGSTDDTEKICKEISPDYYLESKVNYGLASAFSSILNFSKELNIDYLILFDADNQYPADQILDLVNEARNSGSDIVIGERKFKNNQFSYLKNLLQRLGSFVIRLFSGYKIKDATSGFRLYSVNALNKIEISDTFTYTLETILQAKNKDLKISTIKLKATNLTRPSRLFSSNKSYVRNSMVTLVRSVVLYSSNKFFGFLFLFFGSFSFLILSRFFLPYFIDGSNSGNIQSLVFGSTILILGFIFLMIGILLALSTKTNYLLKRDSNKKLHEPINRKKK